jgi:hypothetical protein
MESRCRLTVFGALACVATLVQAQQPREPLDIRPSDGEVYYLINERLDPLQQRGFQRQLESGGSRLFATPQRHRRPGRQAGSVAEVQAGDIQRNATQLVWTPCCVRIGLRGHDAARTMDYPKYWRWLGNGVFQLVNRASGQPVSSRGREISFHITPTL